MKIDSTSNYLLSTSGTPGKQSSVDTAAGSFASRLADAQTKAAPLPAPAPTPKPKEPTPYSGSAPPITSYQMISIGLNGYLPVITDDVQQLVDSITSKYLGKPMDDDGKAMWDELAANGVSPEMITANAEYFYAPDGSIVPRSVAVSAGKPPKHA